MTENVCIIGLGYVGLTLAVAVANAGFKVHGVERVEHIRNAVSAGHAHFSEVGLDEELGKHVAEGNIWCEDGLPSAGDANVYIITVGTPLTKDGAINLASLEEVLRSVSNVIQDDDLVILRSTVKAGTSRAIAKRILDESGKDYDLAFCPERTLEGKALLELSQLPQVVGGLTPRSADRAAAFFSKFSPKIITVESMETAELVKLVNNTQRDLMFAFANEVAEMCDATGVSVTQLIRAACEDYPRSKIPMPGPVGGPCLEKDPHILAEGLREVSYSPTISLAGRRLNEELPRSSTTRMSKLLSSIGIEDLAGKKIVMLGLAFKGQPETDDLRGTMASHILEAARARWPNGNYCAYDAIVHPKEFAQFDLGICATLEEAFEDATLVIIQNNHRAFSDMPIAALMARTSERALVYDFWNLFDTADIDIDSGRHYVGLGTSYAVEARKVQQRG